MRARETCQKLGRRHPRRRRCWPEVGVGAGRYQSWSSSRLIVPAVYLMVLLWVACCGGHFFATAELIVNCCSGPYAAVDCSSGVDYEGNHYFCMGVETPEMRACVSCISATSPDVKCSSCCGTTDSECDLEWSWGAVLATLSVSAVFATCSGVLALAESRRKRKGISLARAWSLPHGMPVLRATVVDLSDAVRRRSAIWSNVGMNGDGGSEEDELEHVALLEEIPNDSVYGALVGQGDADIPIAKLAEDNWVTAMAWRQASGNSVSYEHHVEEEEERQDGPSMSPSTSLSRWTSARAIARQSRRLRSAATARRDSGSSAGVGVGDGGVGGGGGGWDIDEEQEARSALNRARESVAVLMESTSSPTAGTN